MSEEKDVVAVQDQTPELVPLRTSPGWQDYVMSKFESNELADGAPRNGRP